MPAKKPLHFISRDGQTTVFHPESLRYLNVSDELTTLLSSMLDDDAKPALPWIEELAPGALDSLMARLRENLIDSPEAPTEVLSSDRPTVYLNVSQGCNLRCVYCYANFGAYSQTAKSSMSFHTAKTTLDRFLERPEGLGRVVFFGGEPLLQYKLIQDVIAYAQESCANRKMPPPAYAMVSNGSLWTPETAAFAKHHNISVTISIDGPEDIHDALRPDAKGEASFKSVAQGMRHILDAGISPKIEATFTARHLAMGYTPKSLLAFFREEFGVPSVILSPVASTPGYPMDVREFYRQITPLYQEATRYSLESLETSQPIFLLQAAQVLTYLLQHRRKSPEKFCYTRIGLDHFAVSSQGSIFPCQMLNDNAKYNMGSVHDKTVFESPHFSAKQKELQAVNKDHMPCHTCWARNLCFICMAGVEMEKKTMKTVPKHRCDLIKGVISEVLTYLASLQDQPDRREHLIKGLSSPEERPHALS